MKNVGRSKRRRSLPVSLSRFVSLIVALAAGAALLGACYMPIGSHESGSDDTERLSQDDPANPDGPEDGSGSGSEDDPYVVKSTDTLVELLQTDVDLTAHYKLGADLDLSNLEEPWKPIGQRGTDGFSGSFDGGGHTISGFTLDGGDIGTNNYTGFFGVINEGAVVENVGLEGVAFTEDGQPKNTKGALAGKNYGTIVNSFATGSSAIGFISGQDAIGGLVGDNYGRIIDSYARVDILADSVFGGLVGINHDGGEITGSYAAGTLSQKDGDELPLRAGGIAGVAASGSRIERSYFDSQEAGTEKAAHDEGGIVEAEALTTEQAQDEDLLRSAPLHFDFDTVWVLDATCNEGYPYLQVNPPSSCGE